MAIMKPDVDLAEIKYESERLVYEQLRAQLSNDYLVLHSFPWLRPARDLVLREGEADFVIFHQVRGILVLEVKGGEIEYRAPSWYRRVGSGLKAIKNPFEQARVNMHKLNEIIEVSSDGEVNRQDYVYGYAVVFPHHDYSGHVPQDSDPSIIINQTKMQSLQVEIEQAFSAWTKSPRPLTVKQYRAVLDAVLPTFRLFRRVATDVPTTYQQIRELTDEQLQFFRNLYDVPRAFVQGVAGSGKTLLALDRALSYAREGKRTLLVCYNKQLAFWLREQISDSAMDQSCLEHLDVFGFHELAWQLAHRAGVDFHVPRGNPAAEDLFWREHVADIVEQAAALLLDDGVMYRAIVVDEGQDFHTRWWECLNYCLLEESDNGCFYAFADPDQSLWDWAMLKPPVRFDVSFRLKNNCRNTRWIARSSANLACVETNILPRAPLGRRPRLANLPTPQSMKGVVLKAAEDLLGEQHLRSDQIVLIGPNSHRTGSLRDVSEIAEIPLTDSAEEWRRGLGILVTTARAFKGMEAEAVISFCCGRHVFMFWSVTLA